MIAQAVDYQAIISNLTAGSEVTLRGMQWEDYEELLTEVGEASHLRISFDNGDIKIMTLSIKHEVFERLLESLIRLLALRFRFEFAAFGSATMKKSGSKKGSEPDGSYYFQNAERMMHVEQYNFAANPPPDVVVEIDIHHDSLPKFALYADFGVPEFWRYDGDTVFMHELRGLEYFSIERSNALPMLSAADLARFLNMRKTAGELSVLIAFEEWLKTL
jgi:Uma2 family endonuclease